MRGEGLRHQQPALVPGKVREAHLVRRRHEEVLHEELARQGAEAGVQEVVVASEEHGVPRVLELVAAAAPYRRAWPVVRAFSVAVDLLALEAGGSVRGKEE